ncbi:MAG: L,D-transpeptidase family protein, partial [Clostridia bacterium]|nr:L,D-transpeptidase family protein [Clostridia bacterium]
MRFRVFIAAFLVFLLCAAAACAEGLSFTCAPEIVSPGKAERVTLELSSAASLTLEVLDGAGEVVYTIRSGVSLQAGGFTTTFNGLDGNGAALPEGEYTFRAQAGGMTATASFTIGKPAPATPSPTPTATPVPPTPTPEPTPTPSPTPVPVFRPAQDATETIPGDYWTMELGNYNWKAIWQVMISPMTVISGSGETAEKQTYRLRATPDSSTRLSNLVGEITCETQGVHVLETLDNGWTLVEAHNSSYGDAYRLAGKGNGTGYGNTDDLIRGYVETKRLKTFTPRTEYGLLIDKLTQKLYILTEDGLLSTLLVSTGKVNASQPWNETPAGEFYLSSRVGDFNSGNLVCCYGIRFNNGDILHQVPYIYNEKYGVKDFTSTEKVLGEKASHGCIRVQRTESAEGINMLWIWKNVPSGTKLLIWDDDNRPQPFMEYPMVMDAVLYYNPDGGQYYHANQNCSSIRQRYLPLKGSVL